jgi:MftR C-terminal domain
MATMGLRELKKEQTRQLARAEAGDARALDQLRTINQLITASPALLAREQQALNQATSALAGVLAVDTRAAPGDLRPRIAAHALIGVHRTLLDHVRSRVQAGADPAGLAAEIRKVTAGAFELLEQGLHDYAAKPAPAADEAD